MSVTSPLLTGAHRRPKRSARKPNVGSVREPDAEKVLQRLLANQKNARPRNGKAAVNPRPNSVRSRSKIVSQAPSKKTRRSSVVSREKQAYGEKILKEIARVDALVNSEKVSNSSDSSKTKVSKAPSQTTRRSRKKNTRGRNMVNNITKIGKTRRSTMSKEDRLKLQQLRETGDYMRTFRTSRRRDEQKRREEQARKSLQQLREGPPVSYSRTYTPPNTKHRKSGKTP